MKPHLPEKQVRFFHARHSLPQRRVKALPPAIKENAAASSLPKIMNSFLTSQKTSLNAVLTSQTASLKSSRAIISSGKRYMSNNNSNIKSHQKRQFHYVNILKISDIRKYYDLYFPDLSALFSSICVRWSALFYTRPNTINAASRIHRQTFPNRP